MYNQGNRLVILYHRGGILDEQKRAYRKILVENIRRVHPVARVQKYVHATFLVYRSSDEAA
jgi:hypothetical protein